MPSVVRSCVTSAPVPSASPQQRNGLVRLPESPSQRVLLLCGLLAIAAIAGGAWPHRLIPGVTPPDWALAWRGRRWLAAAACDRDGDWTDAWIRRWIAEQRSRAEGIAGSRRSTARLREFGCPAHSRACLDGGEHNISRALDLNQIASSARPTCLLWPLA